jgi:hypothetical protein
MKAKGIRYLLVLLLAAALSPAYLCAQLQLGSYTLFSAPAPELRDPTHLRIGVTSQRMLAGVGGVAFDQIAAPAAGLEVRSLELDWSPSAPDGSRLGVKINGTRYPVPLHNWQLIPIARFADSDFYAAVTLFGRLNDPVKEKQIREQHGDIINYHPALADTLIGLRIFQLDVLILEVSATDLPKQKDRYLLGAGEAPPDANANGMGWNNYVGHVDAIEADLKQRFRSYLICDHDRPVRFGLQGEALSITGAPLFYCWRYKMDDPGHDMKAAGEAAVRDLTAQLEAARAAVPEKFDEREFYIAALLKLAAAYQESYSFYSSGTVVDLVKIQEEEGRKAFLRRYATESLRRMVLDLRIRMDADDVVYLKEYSERLSAKPEVLRAINPQVWDAGVNLMRWSAFFRWVKRDYPAEWGRFLEQTKGIAVEPVLKTPTIRMPAQSAVKK